MMLGCFALIYTPAAASFKVCDKSHAVCKARCSRLFSRPDRFQVCLDRCDLDLVDCINLKRDPRD
jgi:hypothetical protein